MDKSFCERCDKDTEYTVTCHKYVEKLYEGERVVVDNYYTCKCKECGKPMWVLEYEDENLYAVYNAYAELKGLPKHKRLQIGKYLIMQNAENGHIMITSEDGFYFHANQSKLMTDEELEGLLNKVLSWQQQFE